MRPKSSCLRIHSETTKKPSIVERSLIEKSSSWKLPPNVYRLQDHFEEVAKKQMGKLGPYQCFTVERDTRTVRNHYAPKPLEDVSEIFYNIPSGIDELMLKSCNRYKSKFLKSERFEKAKEQSYPSPSKYYPQNWVIKNKKLSKTSKVSTKKKELFYYPCTTVPIKEMLFNKETFSRPAPGRYDPHDVTCKCYLNDSGKKCPGNVLGNGHKYVFDSTEFRLVSPVTSKKRIHYKDEVDDKIVNSRPPREPISFRVQRSLSSDDLFEKERVIHFNTMVKKRNLFSVKTGRPVAFLTAMPRFQEASEVSLHLDKERAIVKAMEDAEKSQRKPITKKRLEELAAPKNPLPKIISHKLNIFETSPSTQKIVKRLSIIESPSAMSELMLMELEAEEVRDSQLFCYGSQSVK